jgi:hypothetical protein
MKMVEVLAAAKIKPRPIFTMRDGELLWKQHMMTRFEWVDRFTLKELGQFKQIMLRLAHAGLNTRETLTQVLEHWNLFTAAANAEHHLKGRFPDVPTVGFLLTHIDVVINAPATDEIDA